MKTEHGLAGTWHEHGDGMYILNIRRPSSSAVAWRHRFLLDDERGIALPAGGRLAHVEGGENVKSQLCLSP